MALSFSDNFLLLAGLCSVLSGSQTKSYQMTGASNLDTKNQEASQCQDVALTITNISLALLQQAINRLGQSNIVFSPVSITSSFAMLSLGAKGNTQKQILKGLRLNLISMAEVEVHRCFQYLLQTLLQPDYQFQLTAGSSLFIHKNLKLADKFKKVITKLYLSEAIPINFRDTEESVKQVNNYVEKKTYGEILHVVKDLPADAALALVNYISFSGNQNGEFQAEHIEEKQFYLDKGNAIYVPMINRLGDFYLYKDKSLSIWVLIQHYVGDAIAFFILPDLGKIRQVVQNLSYEYLNSIQRHTHPRFAKLYLPKFSISATYDLKTVVKALNITQIFSREADLSKVTKGVPVKLSKAVHKAVLSIEDKEPEVREVPDLLENHHPNLLTVKFNKPFIVIIKDDTLDFPFLVSKVGDPKSH